MDPAAASQSTRARPRLVADAPPPTQTPPRPVPRLRLGRWGGVSRQSIWLAPFVRCAS